MPVQPVQPVQPAQQPEPEPLPSSCSQQQRTEPEPGKVPRRSVFSLTISPLFFLDLPLLRKAHWFFVSQQRPNILAFPQKSILFKGKKRKKLLKHTIQFSVGESRRTIDVLPPPKAHQRATLVGPNEGRATGAGACDLDGAKPRCLDLRAIGPRTPYPDVSRDRKALQGDDVNACKRRVNILF